MEHYSHREGRKMMGKPTNGYGTPFTLLIMLVFELLLQYHIFDLRGLVRCNDGFYAQGKWGRGRRRRGGRGKGKGKEAKRKDREKAKNGREKKR